MNKRHFRPLRFLLLTLSLLLCGYASALPNMGDPMRPGDLVGEPSPLLDSIHVPEEQLVIDMRPVAKGESAVVRATYRLRNDGAAKNLDLMFVAGGYLHQSADGFTLLLDGVPVAGRFSDSLPLPLSWRLPSHTPGLRGEDSLSYEVFLRNPDDFPDRSGDALVFPSATHVILFSLYLPQGEHTVSVTYRVDPAAYGYDSPVYIRQLGYVLSPARRWGSFGRLEARVLLPEGWEAAVWPQMERRGDSLFGAWNGLPADAIALSTRVDVSATAYWIAGVLPFILAAFLAVLLTFRLGWKKGLQLAREEKALIGVIPLAIFCTILSGIIVGAGLMGGEIWKDSLLAGQDVPDYGVIGILFSILIFGPILWLGLLIAFPVTMIAAAMARRRVLRDASPSQTRNPEPRERI